jgi:RF-1 domain
VTDPSIPRPPRATWANLTDAQRLAQCDVDTYRASGPGGQKRNKTSSAVRLRHTPTGLIVIAEESRSQHDNKAKCLVRLYQSLFLHLRDPLPLATQLTGVLAEHPDFAPARSADGRIHLRAKDPRFWPAVGVALDGLTAAAGQVSTLADWLGTSTANVIDFLQTDPKVWQEANRIRQTCGLKGLKVGD